MGFKRFELLIIIQIILLAVTIFILSYTLNTEGFVFSILYFSILIIVQLFFLYLTITNHKKKITSFLKLLKSGESTEKFKSKSAQGSYGEIENLLNDISDSVMNIKIEKESEHNFYNNLISNIGIGMIAYNESGKVLLSNPAVKKIFSISKISQIKELNILYIDFEKKLSELRINKPELIKFFIGQQLMELSLILSEFVIKNERIKLISIHDIRNELAQEEIENWQRLIRVLTHEIMNSVFPISSLSSSLIDSFEEHKYPESLEGEIKDIFSNTYKGLRAIEKRSAGLNSFVQSYNDLSKIPKPVFEDFSIQGIFQHIKTLLEQEASSKAIEFKYKVFPDNLNLRADEKLVSQVIINLVNNSVSALKKKDNPVISLNAYVDPGGNTIISVSDNGFGISRENLEKIFVPFFTTKNEGSGIGLSISRQIMRLHGGNISVSSEPDVETVFYLSF
ncbi:PAS domain-containing sensor histidine kinase [Bacteroidota bacterium]